MRVALVHDWLTGLRGGERVLEALVRIFPGAEIFTLLHRPGSTPGPIEERPIHVSPLQRVPGIFEHYRRFLPLMPAAVRWLDVRGFDLVVSSSHCVAKGVPVPDGVPHLAYVHAPMRYVWNRFDDYFGPGRASLPVRLAARAARPALRAWDRRSSAGISRIVANSAFVAAQIRTAWDRSASVVHPPVDLRRFGAGSPGLGRGGYFLWLGALAPYKRVDVAVEAFRGAAATLVIAGDGQDASRLTRGLPANVRWLGKVPDADVPALYRDARALIFPGEEDFGIAPLEAQASGRPVIALARGGALETVTTRTGLLFSEQTPASLAAAVRAFDAFEAGFRPEDARAQARLFSPERFGAGIRRELEALLGPRSAAGEVW